MLDDRAVAEINAVLAGTPEFDAYLIRRRDYFMGKMLRFSGVNPWHLRLFRSGVGPLRVAALRPALHQPREAAAG